MLERKIVEGRIGKGFADRLDEPYVTIAGVILSRRDIIEDLRVGNFAAARRLEATLKNMRITSLKRLAATDPMSLYRIKGFGDAQMFVTMSFLASRGTEPEAWWGRFDTKREQERAKRRAKKEGGHE
jgi:hypothetical protein